MKPALLSATLLLSLLPSPVWSGTPNPVPEPGSFELLALAGVVAAVIAVRKRRKK